MIKIQNCTIEQTICGQRVHPLTYQEVECDPHEALKALEEQAPEVLREWAYQAGYSACVCCPPYPKVPTPTPEQILARLKELRDDAEEEWFSIKQSCPAGVSDIRWKGRLDEANYAVSEIEKMIGGE